MAAALRASRNEGRAPAAKPDPASRAEMAADHLAKVRAKITELDARGEALVREHADLTARRGDLALDAIEDETKTPALAALRARLAEIPEEIRALQAAREEAEGQLEEAQAAAKAADIQKAREDAYALLDQRERLAREIDAALTTLGRAWDAFTKAGHDLWIECHQLGIETSFWGGLRPEDDARHLKDAIIRSSEALGETVGFFRSDYERAPGAWQAGKLPMAAAGPEGFIRERLETKP